ncbi:MAG: DUF1206 domain-containing protein [Kofleriaceae bacterium]|nr:DUF1206 domain-containing protein [Kofleriaceae bacterium]
MQAGAVMQNAEDAVRDHAREVAPWINRLARLGFFAKAVLYATVGVLASAAALRLGGSPATGSLGAMATLVAAPFGRVLLWTIALGLFGYAAWRVIYAIVDPERKGRDAKGIVLRVSSLVTAGIHVALGVSALKLALGDHTAAQDGRASQQWTARVLTTPGGELVLWGIAAGFVAYGAYQVWRAWRAKLDRGLALGHISPTARRALIHTSRLGIAARGIVFGTVGVLLGRAALHHDPRHARGTKQALGTLFDLGRGPFIVVAVGLIAYGLYQLINARYRRIEVA